MPPLNIGVFSGSESGHLKHCTLLPGRRTNSARVETSSAQTDGTWPCDNDDDDQQQFSNRFSVTENNTGNLHVICKRRREKLSFLFLLRRLVSSPPDVAIIDTKPPPPAPVLVPCLRLILCRQFYSAQTNLTSNSTTWKMRQGAGRTREN